MLFVCIGNSCRSPMAEAIARQDAGDKIEAFSAGLAPLGFISQMTMQTLVQNGYAIDGLESKPIEPEIWKQVDIVINMSGRAREHAFRDYAKVEDWLVEDPYGDPEAYPKTFAAIRQRVAELATRLTGNPPAGWTRNAEREKNAKSGSRGDGV